MPYLIREIRFFFLLLLSFGCALSSAETSVEKPAYIIRGDLVDPEYGKLVETMQVFKQQLEPMLRDYAPQQLFRLENVAPEVQLTGYQRLPKIIPDSDTGELPRVKSWPFSWPLINTRIENSQAMLGAIQPRLFRQIVSPNAEIQTELKDIVDKFLHVEGQRSIIDQNIKHSRFWQNAIHQDIPRFTKLTQLHDAALKQQSLRDQIADTTDIAIRRQLNAERHALQSFIDENRETEKPPSWLRINKPSAGEWVIHVKINTDIQDQAFLKACLAAIHDKWQVSTAEWHYSVQVELKQIDSTRLYPQSTPPASGEEIIAWQHADRFPPDSGTFTSGARSTHAMAGRYVIFGANDITPNVIAHEFGHILGFDDRYFRGFRNLGAEGYEILEVVPSYTDIMAAPNRGHVSAAHFELLISAIKAANK